VIVATTWSLAGHRVVETKGVVFGLVVRSRGLLPNLWAVLRSLGGGEIRVYSDLLERSRRDAIERMVAKAEALGANAILSMRFAASQIGGAMTEIVACGTAAVLEPGEDFVALG
jgi:uncharacterized protein YbjQ (UPF0145 family)